MVLLELLDYEDFTTEPRRNYEEFTTETRRARRTA